MREPTVHTIETIPDALLRPVRILLIEDDRLDRMALERHVMRQRLPYEIVTAESGVEAMQKLRAASYDVVLLDYMLGDMTGLELMPELRGHPAIFITGSGNEEVAVSAIRQGAYSYLVKDSHRAYLNMLPFVIGSVLERKRLEEAMQETQRRMEALLETLSGMAFRSTAGPDRKLLSVSAACRELTGYSVSELVEAGIPSFTELIVPEDRARVEAALAEALASGRGLDCSYRIMTRTGLRKWVRERTQPVHAAIETPGADAPAPYSRAAALEGYLEDVTAQIQAENQLRLAKVDTDEASKVKDRFMNLFVHDLRAPLSTCMLTVQQLRQELTDFANAHGIPEATERRLRFASMFDGMTDRTTDMLNMIDQILLGTRVRSGKIVPNLRPVGRARIQSVVDSLESLARQKGIALTSGLPDDFRLLADPDLLAEVIQNLLTNAIKFTPTNGSIHVGALGPEAHGLFVRDTGVGIPEEAIPVLFNPDSRYTTLGTAAEKGTGMGLAMCDEIVAAHGGNLEIRSAPGEGTEVRVRMPLGLPRLLAVGLRSEDERVARTVATELRGELMLAASGDALTLARERMPQAVLLNGSTSSAAAALLALRADPVLRDVPVIWLGTSLAPGVHIPDEHLDAPLEGDALRVALRAAFGG